MGHFIMNVGLPASGKSYYACHLNGYEVFSSDDIRNEMFPAGDGYTKEHQAMVFGELHKRLKNALNSGKNAVYDATNLNRERRMAFLKEIKNIKCTKSCYLFIESLDVLKIRNMFREATVPDEVYDRMIRHFQVPIMREGWNEIKLINRHYEQFNNNSKFLEELDQHNEHHKLTIGGHNARAVDLVRQNPEFQKMRPEEKTLISAATQQHDIGKVLTMTKTNSKGLCDGNWHYYGHNFVGSYLALTNRRNYESFGMGILDLALLIELHMKPFQWAKNPKLKDKDRAIYGDWAINAVDMIHNADLMAH